MPGRGTVFLILRCGDRPDLRTICSIHGSSAQYLTIRSDALNLERGFVKGARDLELSPADYVSFIEPTAQEQARNGRPDKYLVGDFVRRTPIEGDKASALRVWYSGSDSGDFQKESDMGALLGGDLREIGIRFIRPTVRCENTFLKYKIETMALPLPQTIQTYEGPESASSACMPLSPPARTEPRPEIRADQLMGKWSKYFYDKNLSTIDVTVTLTSDMRFTQISELSGKPWMKIAGVWSLQRDVLSWRVQTDSESAFPPGLVEIDEVISAEPDKLFLLSRARAKLSELVRVR